MCGETAAALLSCVLCLNARALILIHRTFMCILHIFSCTTAHRVHAARASRSSPSTDPTPAPCTPNLWQAQYRAIRTWPAHAKLSGCTCQVPEPTHLQPERGTHDPCEAGSCATASYCLSGVAHDNCLPHRRARRARVAAHSSGPAQRRRRRTCEGGACMRWYGIGDRACMRVMCCVRVRT